MKRYTVKPNLNYKVGLIAACVIMFVSCVICCAITWGADILWWSILAAFMLICLLIVLYGLGKEIVFRIDVYDSCFVLRTLFRSRKVRFSEIKYIRRTESSRVIYHRPLVFYYSLPVVKYIFYGEKKLFKLSCDGKTTNRFDEFLLKHFVSSSTPDNCKRFLQTFCELGLMRISTEGEYLPVIKYKPGTNIPLNIR